MTTIAVTLIVSFMAVFAVMAASIVLVHWLVNRHVGTKHRLLEEIVTTRKLPEDWSRSMSERQAMKRLDRLARYVRTTRLVQDEETRETLIAELELVRQALKGPRGA